MSEGWQRLPGRRLRLGLGAALVLLILVAAPVTAARTGSAYRLLGSPSCGPSIARNEPTTASTPPPPAPGYFAPDFPVIRDSRLHVPIGGFGGLRFRSRLHHTPVIFVHGNQADAQNWLSVMVQFQNDAGYSMQEMYALSYNGLGNAGSGAATSAPTQPDSDYFRQNPQALGNGGHGAADDDEVPDLCRFVEAVQWYTGSRQVDIVSHSLGVTIIRELMRLYPSLAHDVTAFVGIAGGNHGTTVCRGLESTWYGCNEIAPGTAWLSRLNGPGGSRETYRPTRWMTIYDGLEGDPLFVGPDAGSPQLRGADNRTFPGAYHNDLRVDPAEVDTYLAFLLARGQAGPGADDTGAQQARGITATRPDGRSGELCGVPRLTGPVSGCRSAFTVAPR
jgi:pimeloyl-ACP methyl ester carboxylesterase